MKNHLRVVVSNQTGEDLKVLMSLTKEFLPFAQKQLGFWKPVKIIFKGDEENAANPLGKTGYYDPQSMEIGVYASGRHPKDILRSLAHELTHHAQNCQGQFSDDLIRAGETGADGTYAQTNTHLRSMEAWAYEKGNLCLRDWENTRTEFLKEHNYFTRRNTMSTTKQWKDKELFTLLSEAWGYDTSALTEGGYAYKKEDDKKDDKGHSMTGDDPDNYPEGADSRPKDGKVSDYEAKVSKAIAGNEDDDAKELDEGSCGTAHKKEDKKEGKCPRCGEEPCKCDKMEEMNCGPGKKEDERDDNDPRGNLNKTSDIEVSKTGGPRPKGHPFNDYNPRKKKNEGVEKTTVTINEEFIRNAIREGIKAHFNK